MVIERYKSKCGRATLYRNFSGAGPLINNDYLPQIGFKLMKNQSETGWLNTSIPFPSREGAINGQKPSISSFKFHAEPTNSDFIVYRDDQGKYFGISVDVVRFFALRQIDPRVDELESELERVRMQNALLKEVMERVCRFLLTTTSASDKEMSDLAEAAALVGYEGPNDCEDPVVYASIGQALEAARTSPSNALIINVLPGNYPEPAPTSVRALPNPTKRVTRGKKTR